MLGLERWVTVKKQQKGTRKRGNGKVGAGRKENVYLQRKEYWQQSTEKNDK